jgi:hypothetical protein
VKNGEFLYGFLDDTACFEPLCVDGLLQFLTENFGYASSEVEGHFRVAVVGYIAGEEESELFR